MADWSSLYYRQTLTDPGKVSTTGYTAFTFAMAIGRLMGDRLIQVLRFRNTLIFNGVLIACGLTLALAMAGALCRYRWLCAGRLRGIFGFPYCLYDRRKE